MATLGIRKNAWQGLSARNKTIVRFMGDVLQLGVPAEFESGGGTVWFVFDDHRFRPKAVAYFGVLVANLGSVPAGYQLPLDGVGNVDKPRLRRDAKTFLDPLLVWPVTFPDDDPNPWQTILDAQGAPAAVRMGSGVPAGWTPVQEAV